MILTEGSWETFAQFEDSLWACVSRNITEDKKVNQFSMFLDQLLKSTTCI